ncbi:MAG: RHS repeat domain-containing protein [Bacteroidota bacterium]
MKNCNSKYALATSGTLAAAGGVTNTSELNDLALLQNQTAIANGQEVFNMLYAYNTTLGQSSFGEMINRTDQLFNQTEDFEYDNHRLKKATVNNIVQFNIQYSSNGNIQSKSDVGNYQYASKPHAVNRVTDFASPFPIPLNEQNIKYNVYNFPLEIAENNKKLKIEYDIFKSRVKSSWYTLNPNNPQEETLYKEKLYLGNIEIEKDIVAQTSKQIHYINSPTGLCAVFIKNINDASQSETSIQMLSPQTDHLGSIALLSNEIGQVLERNSYDAWGRARSGTSWNIYETETTIHLLDRGYTFHEMLPEFRLINMNARLYDPILCRMLSPDEYLLDPQNSQNYNKYSYALNNPIRFTDPTGNNPYWVWEKGQLVEKQETKAQIERRERYQQWKLDNVSDGNPKVELDYFAAADRMQNKSLMQFESAIKLHNRLGEEENLNNQTIIALRNKVSGATITMSMQEYNALPNDIKQQFDNPVITLKPYTAISEEIRVGSKRGREGAQGGGGGNNWVETVFDINSSIDNSLTLTSGSIVGAQRLANSVAKTSYKVITEVPVLHTLGRLTGAVSIVDNFMKFKQDPSRNLWNGIEGAGQLGFWLLVGGEAELIFNLSTMTIDAGVGLYNYYNSPNQLKRK